MIAKNDQIQSLANLGVFSAGKIWNPQENRVWKMIFLTSLPSAAALSSELLSHAEGARTFEPTSPQGGNCGARDHQDMEIDGDNQHNGG